MEKLCRAGLDSIRISLNSAREKYYGRYFKPKGYGLDDVIRSMRIAKDHGVWTSLNYFIYPGFTDGREEMDALKRLLVKVPVDMIQMRNLNMDPDMYHEILGPDAFDDAAAGVRKWMAEIGRFSPSIRFGYFNPYIP